MSDRDRFKVWDKEKKEWLKGYDIENHFIDFEGNLVRDESSYTPEEPVKVSEQFQLVRCTGIKLEDGVLIYDGYIVYVAGFGNCKVLWSDEEGGWVFENKDAIYDFQDVIGDLEKVIGNIYEHPELDPT